MLDACCCTTTREWFESVHYLVLEEQVLELLLSENLLRLLTPSDQIRHDGLGWAEWQILVDLVIFLSQHARDLVRESLKLTESHPVILNLQPIHPLLGNLNRIVVVRGDEEEAPLVDIVQHVGHALVVARVRLLNCVPDWRGYTVGRSERPLLAHVRAPNQLDAEVVAEGLGAGDLILDDLRHFWR